MKPNFRWLALTAIFAISAFMVRSARAAEPPVTAARPNVIVILADDLGFGDLSCYGHASFKTPHLDRMAAEGAKLTQFNTPMPFCAPTRASLLTGRYPFRCGMNGNPAPDGGPAADTMALREQLKGSKVHVIEALPSVVETQMTAARSCNKMPPQECARQILAAIEGNRAEANVGMVKALRLVESISPALARKIMLRF